MSYSLEITNFQSIKHAKLDFTGFSVICGKSDLGKSALRRATETILFNDWQKSYQRTNTNKTEITFTAPALTIKCTKSKTDNSFIVNDKHIEKIGKEAPELPLKFKQDLNISTQLEPMFMVAYKDTDNTKILNSLFGVDLLEQAQYLCSLDLRRTKQDTQRTQDELTQKQTELETITKANQQLEQLVSRLVQLEQQKTNIARYTHIKQSFTDALAKLEPIDNQCTQTVQLTQRLQTLLEQLGNFYAYKQKRVQYNRTKKALDELQQDALDPQPLEQLLQLHNYLRVIDNIDLLRQRKSKAISFECVSKLELALRYLYVATSESLVIRTDELSREIAGIDTKLSGLVCPTCKQVLQ